MGSLSKRTEERRMNRLARAGKRNKKKRQANSSPKFPIHPEKASAKGADAKKG